MRILVLVSASRSQWKKWQRAGKGLKREKPGKGRRPRIKNLSPVGRDTSPSFKTSFSIFFLVRKDDRSMRQTVIYVKGKRDIWGHLF